MKDNQDGNGHSNTKVRIVFCCSCQFLRLLTYQPLPRPTSRLTFPAMKLVTTYWRWKQLKSKRQFECCYFKQKAEMLWNVIVFIWENCIDSLFHRVTLGSCSAISDSKLAL